MEKQWTFYATVSMQVSILQAVSMQVSILQDDDETQPAFEKWLNSNEGLKAIQAEFRKKLQLAEYPVNAELVEITDIELKEVNKRG